MNNKGMQFSILAVAVTMLLILPAIVSEVSACAGARTSRTDSAAGAHQHTDMGCSMTATAEPSKNAEPGSVMMHYCEVIMNSPIYLDSPAVIQGQFGALNLSDKQKETLRRIENEARKKAMEVLTPEQRGKLGQIPQKPIILAQLCRQMSPVKNKDAEKMSCCAATNAEKQIEKAPVEQTLCPVMGGQINKDNFTEYHGKKVYF